MKSKSNLLKKIIFIIVLIYAITTIIKQQKILNGYSVQEKNLKVEISEAKERQEQLI